MRNFKAVYLRFHLLNHSRTYVFEFVTRGLKLVTRGFKLVTHGFKLVTRGQLAQPRCDNVALRCYQDVATTLLQRRHNIKHWISRPFYYGLF